MRSQLPLLFTVNLYKSVCYIRKSLHFRVQFNPNCFLYFKVAMHCILRKFVFITITTFIATIVQATPSDASETPSKGNEMPLVFFFIITMLFNEEFLVFKYIIYRYFYRYLYNIHNVIIECSITTVNLGRPDEWVD